MLRKRIQPRANWQSIVEALGFSFHTMEKPYWDESAYYEFSLAEIEILESATEEMNRIYLLAGEKILQEKWLSRLGIPPVFHSLIEESWKRKEPSLYGRFDFSWNGTGEPKLLEFNADTPTSVLETAVVQWQWLEDCFADLHQFNSLHEKLVERWKKIKKDHFASRTLQFVGTQENEEDLGNLNYLQDTAIQAGWEARSMDISDIGWDSERSLFVDLQDQPLASVFKLYPWEFLLKDSFSEKLLQHKIQWLEPPWKLMFSNKAILPILWELYPHHPNLLPAFFENPGSGEWVSKPFYSREGANVMGWKDGQKISEEEGPFSAGKTIFQARQDLPNFSGNFPVLGSWIVGNEAAGLGIRESDTWITDNQSRFVPHLFC